MSQELVKFKQSYEDFNKYHAELLANLEHAYPYWTVPIIHNSYDFSVEPWINLNNKTLAEFKALAIYQKIKQTLLPKMLPKLKLEIDGDIDKWLASTFQPPQKPIQLNPKQIVQAFDSIHEIVQKDLQETIKNHSYFTITLNFIKSCMNFLISMSSSDQKHNFFHSSTFQLEKISQIQQDIHTILDNLSEEEQIVELVDPPTHAC